MRFRLILKPLLGCNGYQLFFKSRENSELKKIRGLATKIRSKIQQEFMEFMGLERKIRDLGRGDVKAVDSKKIGTQENQRVSKNKLYYSLEKIGGGKLNLCKVITSEYTKITSQ